MSETRTRLFTTGIVLLMIESGARGAIISRDFRAPGDGLLTYDDVTQREWLDITETNHSTLAAVQRSLQLGGSLFGFNIATVDDVRSLAASAGYVGTQKFGQQYFSIATQIVDDLGETFRITDNGFLTDYVDVVTRMSDAWAISDSGSLTVLPMTVIAGWKPIVPGAIVLPGADTTMSYVGTAYNEYPGGFDPSPYRGIWLFRQATIPEPATTSIVCAFGCWLALCARMRYRLLS